MTSNGHTAQKGTSATQWSLRQTTRSPGLELLLEVVAEEVAAVPLEVHPLGRELARRAHRHPARRPDLAVRVGVAAPHHRALVLEDLDVSDGRVGADRRHLVRPGVHDRPDGRRVHLGEGQVVARGEAEHPAASGGGLGHEEPALVTGAARLSGSTAAKSLSKAKVAV
jgi:hypothetical protein